MKFSIVTPSFNQGRFLPECIESVLSQDGVDFEHIVTDAGSSDDTLKVLGSYPHVKWTSEPDAGMSDGINKGFLRATGDLVMWLNCDDYLAPNALAKVAEFARGHPESDIIHGDCVYVTEDDRVIRRKYDTSVDEWDLLFVGCIIPSTSTFFRKGIIDQGHLLDVSYRNCMDWEYYLRLLRNGFRYAYLPEPLAHFRWYEDSTTQKHWDRMIREGLQCRREHLAERGLPSVIGNQMLLSVLRKVFQLRRIGKRMLIHQRIR